MLNSGGGTTYYYYYCYSSSGSSTTTTSTNTTVTKNNIQFEEYFSSLCFVEVSKIVQVFIFFHIWKWAAKCVTSSLWCCNISLWKDDNRILTCTLWQLTDKPKHTESTMSDIAANVGFFIHLVNHTLAWNR